MGVLPALLEVWARDAQVLSSLSPLGVFLEEKGSQVLESKLTEAGT